MRSPYGRIFAEPTAPAARQARHGDIWVSPLGLYFFSRSPDQVGIPGTGSWIPVQSSVLNAVLIGTAANTGNVAITAGVKSSQFVLTAGAGGLAAGNTFTLTSANSGIVLNTVVQVVTLAGSSGTTLGATPLTAAGSGAGVITFTVGAGTTIPEGETITFAYAASV